MIQNTACFQNCTYSMIQPVIWWIVEEYRLRSGYQKSNAWWIQKYYFHCHVVEIPRSIWVTSGEKQFTYSLTAIIGFIIPRYYIWQIYDMYRRHTILWTHKSHTTQLDWYRICVRKIDINLRYPAIPDPLVLGDALIKCDSDFCHHWFGAGSVPSTCLK